MKSAEQKKTLKIIELALLIGLAAALLIGAVSLRTQVRLSEKVVRLHVLANSDSRGDQALKLRVRYRVLARTMELLEESSD